MIIDLKVCMSSIYMLSTLWIRTKFLFICLPARPSVYLSVILIPPSRLSFTFSHTKYGGKRERESERERERVSGIKVYSV